MSNNITLLLTALAGPAQDVEAALQELMTERAIDTAEGVNLDMIGVIVDQARQSLDDDTYRAFLRTRIATSRSRGTLPSVLRIARAMLGDNLSTTIVYDNQGIAAFVIRVLGNVIADTIATGLLMFLQLGASAGVRVILERLTAVDDDTLFTPYFGALVGAHSIGATTVTVSGTNNFPKTGSLIIDAGLAVAETVTYTGLISDGIDTLFIDVSALAHNHVSQSGVTSVTPGKGLGDSSDATVGGKFASATAES